MMSEQHTREQVWLWLPGQESFGATALPGNLIVGLMFTLPCVSLHDHVTPSLCNLPSILSLSFQLYWENRTSQDCTEGHLSPLLTLLASSSQPSCPFHPALSFQLSCTVECLPSRDLFLLPSSKLALIHFTLNNSGLFFLSHCPVSLLPM